VEGVEITVKMRESEEPNLEEELCQVCLLVIVMKHLLHLLVLLKNYGSVG